MKMTNKRGDDIFSYQKIVMNETNLISPYRAVEELHRRFRRSLLIEDDSLQLTEQAEKSGKFTGLMNPEFWADTPCSKQIFCHVMLQQHPDEVVFMEKKMNRLLSS